MYDEGKEPRVRFETEVTLSEILDAGGCDLDADGVVELAVAIKLLRRNAQQRWSEAVINGVIQAALFSAVQDKDEVHFGPDTGGVLVRYGFEAEKLAEDVVQRMLAFDAVAALAEWNLCWVPVEASETVAVPVTD
jgi:hypothetical protein